MDFPASWDVDEVFFEGIFDDDREDQEGNDIGSNGGCQVDNHRIDNRLKNKQSV